MAGDEGRSGRDERDPFEDLDQFFAPIEDVDESEELPSTPVEEPEGAADEADVSEEEAAEALEDLEVEIELPEDSDLLEGLPEAGEEEAAEPEPVGAAEEAAEAGPDLEAEAEGEEWDRVRAETLAAAGAEGIPEEPAEAEGEAPEPSIPEVGPDLEGYPGLTDEDIADLEGVEVEEEEAAAAGEFADVGAAATEERPADEAEEAAEHFATGMRESPEELERELLSDLEEGEPSETVRIEPTEPVAEGPTWQEGAQPVVTEEPPPAAAPAARNIPAALVSGILLGAGVLALLAINKGAFVVLATAAVLLAQAELYAVMRTRGLQPATLLGLVCGGFTFVGGYLHGETAVLLGPALAMGLTVPWYIAAPLAARKNTTANTAATVLGVVYVPFLASFIMLLLRQPGEAGRNLFLAVLVITVLYDVVAYAVGSVWGNRPLAPTVSPQKSWEGAIAATFVILLVALGVIPNFTPFNGDGGPGVAVGLALVIAVVAPLGDLVESAFKRDLGVKDMGSLLPGHGGMLDRIDAVLFAAPAAYFFLRIALG